MENSNVTPLVPKDKNNKDKESLVSSLSPREIVSELDRFVVVRTKRKTNYENKLRKKITTSGCAIGTVFGDIYEEIKQSKLKSKKKN